MPIISVEIMKKIDERELQKTTKERQTKTESSKGNRSYTERVRAKWFCCAFKFGVLQLIWEASNPELTKVCIFIIFSQSQKATMKFLITFLVCFSVCQRSLSITLNTLENLWFSDELQNL